MKFLLCLFSITLFAKGCSDSNPEKETIKNAQDDITIEYKASSRGFYQDIKLSKTQFAYKKVRDGKVSVLQDVSSEDWNEIIELLDKIDAEKFKNDTVNPDDIARDAAIPATLTINYKENVVRDIKFGHGNPPKELAALVNKIQAMAKAVDKP
ncbi:MAG: hypothetical protein AB8B65_07005 [Kordia sp.]|uniref:hypothetical protein n=1 Tax=Kordia sp. TaxID=1965332 RepID=UPI00385926F3